MENPRIFISYAHKDPPRVQALYKQLCEAAWYLQKAKASPPKKRVDCPSVSGLETLWTGYMENHITPVSIA